MGELTRPSDWCLDRGARVVRRRDVDARV